MSHRSQQFMQCMEVWGGNQAADNGVVMAGLDAWVYARPFGESTHGGDVYYVSSCATNRILRLLVADVSGHGETVQGLAAELRRAMRRYVNHIDHVQFVRAMNRQFSALARVGLFATALVSTFFAPTGRLTLCNAGHPPPLLYRAASRRWSYLAADDDASAPAGKPGAPRDGRGGTRRDAAQKPSSAGGPLDLPLGILDVTDYRTFDVPLRTGDLVLCYTDCLVETRGRDGELLGQRGLLDAVEALDTSDPGALIPALIEKLTEQFPGNLTTDDVTILLFRPNGLGRPRPSLAQQVRAVGVMLGAIAGSLRPGGDPVPWPDFKLPNLGGALFRRLNRSWSAPKDE
jgi:sigma-B regulation protein RsbU (phosphoserine phosphatase)